MSRKPTFLFVPGAWHLPPYFDHLITYLSSHGYPSVAVTLPAVNSSPAVTSLQPDVDAVVAALAALLDSGSDVVVVMHSYGGMVGTDAVGRVVKERAEADDGDGCDKKGGKIRRLVYVTAHVPLEGQTLFQAIEGEIEGPPPPVDHALFEGPYIVLKEEATDVLYHDLPEALISTYARLLGKQPTATFNTPVAHAGWRSVPSTYVYTTQDRSLPLAYQRFMAKRAKEVAGKEGSSVKPFDGEIGEVSVDSGHTPFLSMTDKMGDILIRAADT